MIFETHMFVIYLQGSYIPNQFNIKIGIHYEQDNFFPTNIYDLR